MTSNPKLFDILVNSDGKSLWPNPKLESWKYFDHKKLNAFREITVNSSEPKISVVTDQFQTIQIDKGQYFVSQDLIDAGIKFELEKGVTVLNPETTIDHRFLKLNQTMSKLKVIFQGIKLEQKIEIRNLNQDGASKSAFASSLFFELQDSDISLLQILDGEGLHSESFNSVLLQTELQSSKLRHFVMEKELSIDKAVIYTTEARLHGESNYKIFLSTLNSQFVRNQNSVHVLSQNAKAEILSFTLGSQKSYIENRTEISLFDRNSESKQLVKAILSDEAQMVFNGRIYVSQQALKTESSQTYKGLLLSKKALMNAKPELEIYADDVKAAHGAAIGQVSDEEIFYLLSRGIAPEKAYELLAQAFAGEVINEIKDIEIRKQIESDIIKASEPIFQDLLQTYKKARK